jgi:predicted RNA-binding protein YlqC (UPF0109 family)
MENNVTTKTKLDNAVAEDVRKWIEDGLKILVDNKESLNITATIGDNSVFYLVNADREDRGKIIGKGGKVANGFRLLLSPMGKRHDIKFDLRIVE